MVNRDVVESIILGKFGLEEKVVLTVPISCEKELLFDCFD